jgi:hypothetical protein
MDIKEIKTEGYERVIRGCDEKSNFNAFIAIHTLKKWTRIWWYTLF